jgi:predicted alpha/beta hydrolase family esterase
MKPPVLLLPGWQNSGPEHWQSRWEALFGYRRVEQHDWMRPLRGDWIARLEEVLLGCGQAAVLVAHSLGCIQVAAWAAHTRNPGRVRAALLVAPGDVERTDMREVVPSWPPIPMKPLPFRSMLLISRDDPYCAYERAQAFGRAWGSEVLDQGARGHLNAESGLGDWPEGHELLQQLIRSSGQAPNKEGQPSW